MRSHLEQIPDGDAGLAVKLDRLRKLVDDARADPAVIATARRIVRHVPERDLRGDVAAVRAFVQRSMRYTADPVAVELFTAPRQLLADIARDGVAFGDCDDQTGLASALLESIGRPTRFRVGGRGRGRWSHIWLDVDGFGAMDPIVRNRGIGFDPSRAFTMTYTERRLPRRYGGACHVNDLGAVFGDLGKFKAKKVGKVVRKVVKKALPVAAVLVNVIPGAGQAASAAIIAANAAAKAAEQKKRARQAAARAEQEQRAAAAAAAPPGYAQPIAAEEWAAQPAPVYADPPAAEPLPPIDLPAHDPWDEQAPSSAEAVEAYADASALGRFRPGRMARRAMRSPRAMMRSGSRMARRTGGAVHFGDVATIAGFSLKKLVRKVGNSLPAVASVASSAAGGSYQGIPLPAFITSAAQSVNSLAQRLPIGGAPPRQVTAAVGSPTRLLPARSSLLQPKLPAPQQPRPAASNVGAGAMAAAAILAAVLVLR